MMVAEAKIIDHVIQTIDDMEGINADFRIREVFLGQGYESIAHIAAEVFDALTLFKRELLEVFMKIGCRNLIQYIDDCMRVSIRDVAVIFVEIPLVMLLAPYTGIPFEFINVDGFRKVRRKAEIDCFQYGLHNAFGDAVFSGDFSLGDGFHEI